MAGAGRARRLDLLPRWNRRAATLKRTREASRRVAEIACPLTGDVKAAHRNGAQSRAIWQADIGEGGILVFCSRNLIKCCGASLSAKWRLVKHLAR